VAKLERHHFHLNALEKILRMWENESLTKEEVRDHTLQKLFDRVLIGMVFAICTL